MTQPRWFAVIGGLLLTLVFIQSLGTPPNAGPDEPAHVVRSAGIVRGDVFGEAVDSDDIGDVDAGAADIANADAGHEAIRVYDVPNELDNPSPACYAHDPNAPASCAAGVVIDRGADDETIASTAGTYPIWGHLLPGLGTFFPADSAIYFARLLHALIPVALVAAALARLLTDGRRFAAAATLLAVTPMALFTFAVVNPSGIAIAGAVALWVTGDDLLRNGRLGWLLPAALAASILPRDDGLLWTGLIAAVLLAVHRVTPIAAWRMLDVRTRVVGIAAAIAGAAWTLLVGADLVPVDRPAEGLEFAEIVVQRTGRHLREAVGSLGWLDTDLPESAFALWCVGVGLVVMVALVARQYQRALGAVAALALTIVVGWLLEIVQGQTAGLFWQGRYALPMFVGVILVAALTVDADRIIGRVAAIVPAVVSAVVWNLAFFQGLRRWGVGAFGSIRPWNWDTFDAPLPIVAVVVFHLAASATLVWKIATAPDR